MRTRLDKLAVFGMPETGSGMAAPARGTDWYVSTFDGKDANAGTSWKRPLATLSEALSRVATHDRIFFVGKNTEELVGSNLVFDVSIIGCGSLHHADQPGSGSDLYDYGAAIIAPPASPTTATSLLEIRGRGWKLINLMFDCPVDAAGVKAVRNASSGTDEYDPSHLSVIGCRFVDGKYGIQDSGGIYNVTVKGCEFKAMTTAAIANTSTSVANPLNWKIKDCLFPADVSSFGNATHIDSPLNSSFITDSIFGTVTSTALYVDLTGGNGNFVTRNLLGGSYDTSDYVSGTGDNWSGNITADISGNAAVDASGLTIAVPGAP